MYGFWLVSGLDCGNAALIDFSNTIECGRCPTGNLFLRYDDSYGTNEGWFNERDEICWINCFWWILLPLIELVAETGNILLVSSWAEALTVLETLKNDKFNEKKVIS